MNARELLEQLQELGEHDRIEAKAASRIGHSVLETVCTFANEPSLGGGWWLLGIEENLRLQTQSNRQKAPASTCRGFSSIIINHHQTSQ